MGMLKIWGGGGGVWSLVAYLFMGKPYQCIESSGYYWCESIACAGRNYINR